MDKILNLDTKYLIIIGAVCLLLLILIIAKNVKKKKSTFTNDAQSFIDTVTIRFNIDDINQLTMIYQDIMGYTQNMTVTANFNEEKKELFLYTKNPWGVRETLAKYIQDNKLDGKVIVAPRQENITLK